MPPLGVSEYCHNVWCGKTRNVWLPDSEKRLMICLAISTEYRCVTDSRTDRQTYGCGLVTDSRTDRQTYGCGLVTVGQTDRRMDVDFLRQHSPRYA